MSAASGGAKAARLAFFHSETSRAAPAVSPVVPPLDYLRQKQDDNTKVRDMVEPLALKEPRIEPRIGR